MRKSEMIKAIEDCDRGVESLKQAIIVNGVIHGIPKDALTNLMAEIRGLYKRVNALTEYLEVEFALRPAEPEKIVVEKKKKKTS